MPKLAAAMIESIVTRTTKDEMTPVIEKSTPIALIMPDQAEGDKFSIALAELGFRKITRFHSTKEAYEVCIRQQFPVFITKWEMAEMSGLVFIQKLRETGNYGLESHLFVCQKIDNAVHNSLYELEMPYVIASPYDREGIKAKFSAMVTRENNLPAAETKYREARSAYDAGMGDMAFDLCQDIVKEFKDFERALVLCGDIRLQQDKLEEARSLYQQAESINQSSPVPRQRLAELLMKEGKFDAAADMLDNLARVNPYSLKTLENAGVSNFKADRLDAAREHMQKLSSFDQENKQATTITAEVAIRKGDFEATAAALRSNHTDKEIISFLNNAGAKLSKGDDVAGAIRMYQSCLKEIPESPFLYAVHFNLGVAYRKMNDPETAKQHLKQSLVIKPGFEKAQKILDELAAGENNATKKAG